MHRNNVFREVIHTIPTSEDLIKAGFKPETEYV